jgi:CBS domain-containing protein
MVSELLAYVMMTLGLLGLFSGNTASGLWQVLIGMFLLSAARSTYQQLVMKTALGGRTVNSMMTRIVVRASPEDSLADVVDRLMLPNARSFIPVSEGEHLLGYVDTALIRRIDRENWDSTHVNDIFIASDGTDTVPPDLPAKALLRRIAETGRRKFLVADGQRLLGVISLSDLLSYPAVLQEIGANPPALSRMAPPPAKPR